MNFKISGLAMAALVSFGLPVSVSATTGVEIGANGRIIVTVDNGESKKFTEIGADYIAKMGSGGAYQWKQMEKRGGGELVMSTGLNSWGGHLHIFEGNVVNAVKFGLGTDSMYYTTYVYNGSSLVINPTYATNNRGMEINGNGTAGHYGALELQVTGSSYIRDVFPNKIKLGSDSTIAVQSKGSQDSVLEKALDLQKHTLTLTGKGGSDEHRMIISGCAINSTGGAGTIVVDDLLCLRLRQNVNLGSSGTFELKGSGALEICGVEGSPATTDNSGWKVIADSTKGFGGTFNAFSSFTRTGNVWNGPMELRRDTQFKMNSDYYHPTATKKYGILTVNGKISGVGGIYSTGYADANRSGYLMLGNSANDFQGGVAITNMTLGLMSATSLPATGKAAQFTDASLQILEPAAAQPSVVTFPELDFTVSAGKTSEIGSKLDTLADGAAVVGTTTKITKRGAGVLDSKAALTVGEINLDGGVLKLPAKAEREAGARRLQAGLHAGDVKLGISDTPFKATYENGKYLTLCITNRVALSPEIYYLPANYYPAGNNEWGEHYYQRFNSWDGYIWNNTDQVKTWKVVDTCNSIQRLTIGSVENAYAMEADRISPWTDEINSSYAPKTYTVTLQPGANRFIVRTYDRFAYKNFQHGNVRVQGLDNWTDAHGLMYTEKLDSVDMNDYHPFIDSGDGMLFTRVADVSVPAVSVVRGNGGTLDLQDGSLTATTLEGKPIVTGGALTVTGTWTLTADQLKNDVRLAGVTFSESSELEVAAADLAQLKVGAKGYVIASDFAGRVPKVSAGVKSEGWKLLLEDGVLRFAKPQGLVVILR